MRFHIDIILIPHFLLFSKQDIFTTRRECASCCYPCKDNDVRMVTRFLNMACFLNLTVVINFFLNKTRLYKACFIFKSKIRLAFCSRRVFVPLIFTFNALIIIF